MARVSENIMQGLRTLGSGTITHIGNALLIVLLILMDFGLNRYAAEALNAKDVEEMPNEGTVTALFNSRWSATGSTQVRNRKWNSPPNIKNKPMTLRMPDTIAWQPL